MATITKGKTFSTSETVTNTKLHQLVDSATISGIVTADISDSQITAAKIAADAVETAKIKDANVTTSKIADDAVDKDKLGILTTKGDILGYSTEPARTAVGANDTILVADSTETTGIAWKTASAAGIGGKVVQVVNTQSGALTTVLNTELIPYDDTIPQNTEGKEIYTRTITPASATNILIVDVILNVSGGGSGIALCALFQDSTTNALCAVATTLSSSSVIHQLKMSYYMVSGTTSETTFKVRAGMEAADQMYINGNGSGRLLGGVMISGITVTEITA